MVEHLEIFGEKYPVRVGYLVMKTIKEKTGKTLGQALQDAKDDPTIHEDILYTALKMGAYAEKKEMNLPREEMPMILDLVFPQYLKIFSSEKFFPKEALQEVNDKVKDLGKEMGEKPTPEPPKKKKKSKT